MIQLSNSGWCMEWETSDPKRQQKNPKTLKSCLVQQKDGYDRTDEALAGRHHQKQTVVSDSFLCFCLNQTFRELNIHSAFYMMQNVTAWIK